MKRRAGSRNKSHAENRAEGQEERGRDRIDELIAEYHQEGRDVNFEEVRKKIFEERRQERRARRAENGETLEERRVRHLERHQACNDPELLFWKERYHVQRIQFEFENAIRNRQPTDHLLREMGMLVYGNPEELILHRNRPQDYPCTLASWEPPPPCSPIHYVQAPDREKEAEEARRTRNYAYLQTKKADNDRIKKAILEVVHRSKRPRLSSVVAPTPAAEDLSIFSDLRASRPGPSTSALSAPFSEDSRATLGETPHALSGQSGLTPPLFSAPS